MAWGIYQCTVIGEAQTYTNKKTGEIITTTPAALDGGPISLPGNGLNDLERVFVFGDLRNFDRRQFFDDRVKKPIIIRGADFERLEEIVELLQGGAKK